MYDVQLNLSEVINLVLSLLLLMQWWMSRSREKAVVNGLFTTRRIVERIKDLAAIDALDSLDGSLATLGERKPFSQRVQEVIASIHSRIKKESSQKLQTLSPYSNIREETHSEQLVELPK